MSTLSSFSRAKRDQFEEQLRSLQEDISNLSQKLAIPQSPAVGLGNAEHKLYDTRAHHQQLPPAHGTPQYAEVDGAPSNLKAQIARLKKQLHETERERDEFRYRYDQVSRELEDVKSISHELGKFKSLYDNLKYDYDSIKGSLDSSERIRKQQKELIQLMQRSNNIATDVSFQSLQQQLNAPSGGSGKGTANELNNSTISGLSVSAVAAQPDASHVTMTSDSYSYSNSKYGANGQSGERSVSSTAASKSSALRKVPPATARIRSVAGNQPSTNTASRRHSAPPAPTTGLSARSTAAAGAARKQQVAAARTAAASVSLSAKSTASSAKPPSGVKKVSSVTKKRKQQQQMIQRQQHDDAVLSSGRSPHWHQVHSYSAPGGDASFVSHGSAQSRNLSFSHHHSTASGDLPPPAPQQGSGSGSNVIRIPTATMGTADNSFAVPPPAPTLSASRSGRPPRSVNKYENYHSNNSSVISTSSYR